VVGSPARCADHSATEARATPPSRSVGWEKSAEACLRSASGGDDRSTTRRARAAPERHTYLSPVLPQTRSFMVWEESEEGGPTPPRRRLYQYPGERTRRWVRLERGCGAGLETEEEEEEEEEVGRTLPGKDHLRPVKGVIELAGMHLPDDLRQHVLCSCHHSWDQFRGASGSGVQSALRPLIMSLFSTAADLETEAIVAAVDAVMDAVRATPAYKTMSCQVLAAVEEVLSAAQRDTSDTRDHERTAAALRLLLQHKASEPGTPRGEWCLRLGDLLLRRESGCRATNSEDAIRHTEEARELLSSGDASAATEQGKWQATLQLGRAYRVRVEGDKRANLQKATELLEPLIATLREGAWVSELGIGMEKSEDDTCCRSLLWQATYELALVHAQGVRGDPAANRRRAQELLNDAYQLLPHDREGPWSESRFLILRESGELLLRGGSWKNAVKKLELTLKARSLEVWERDPLGHAALLARLATAMQHEQRRGRASNELTKVIADVEEAIERAESKGQAAAAAWAHAQVLLDLGVIHAKRSKHEMAILCLRKALGGMTERHPRLYAALCMELGVALAARARAARTRSHRLADPPKEATVEELQEEALKLFEQVLRVFALETDPAEYARVHEELSRLYLERVRGAKGFNLADAQAHNEAVLKGLEAERVQVRLSTDDQQSKDQIGQRMQRITDQLVQGYLEHWERTERVEPLHKCVRALSAAKARLLRDIADDQAKYRGPVYDGLRDALHHLRSLQASDDPDPQALSRAQATYAKALQDLPPALNPFGAQADGASGIGSKQAIEILGPHAIGLQWYMPPTGRLQYMGRGYGCVALMVAHGLSDGVRVALTLSEQEAEVLRQKCQKLNAVMRGMDCSKEKLKEFEACLHEVKDALRVNDLCEAIRKRENKTYHPMGMPRVVVVPDGPLAGLPWPYLLRDLHKRILSVPSLPLLRSNRLARGGLEKTEATTLVAVPDPTQTLSSTLVEVNTIRALMDETDGKVQTVVVEGADVTAAGILAEISKLQGKPFILHLACHARGTGGPRHGDKEAAGEEGEGEAGLEDGSSQRGRRWAASLQLHNEEELHAHKIAATWGPVLRAGCRMVTLSGCEGALLNPNGRDFLGLSSAFLAAGAPCVLGAVWPVQDQAAGLLMGLFYEHLQHQADPARSLLYAQTALQRMDRGEVEEALRAKKISVRLRGKRKSAFERSDWENFMGHFRAGRAEHVTWLSFSTVGKAGKREPERADTFIIRCEPEDRLVRVHAHQEAAEGTLVWNVNVRYPSKDETSTYGFDDHPDVRRPFDQNGYPLFQRERKGHRQNVDRLEPAWDYTSPEPTWPKDLDQGLLRDVASILVYADECRAQPRRHVVLRHSASSASSSSVDGTSDASGVQPDGLDDVEPMGREVSMGDLPFASPVFWAGFLVIGDAWQSDS
jgi:CHAT domain-containing protein/tetratricopeptide (TPR) repeat protein